MILHKIAHRVTTSLRLVTRNPAKNRTQPFAEQLTSVKNSNCESHQGGSPLQKLAKRPAPQPTRDMKLNVALVECKANKIAEWTRQIEALPDWKQQAKALQECSADRSPSCAPFDRTHSPYQNRVKRAAPQPTLAMKLNAALNEYNANKVAELKLQIEALPNWTQQLQDIRERATDSRDAKPMP
jgi:hypothetical protein